MQFPCFEKYIYRMSSFLENNVIPNSNLNFEGHLEDIISRRINFLEIPITLYDLHELCLPWRIRFSNPLRLKYYNKIRLRGKSAGSVWELMNDDNFTH